MDGSFVMGVARNSRRARRWLTWLGTVALVQSLAHDRSRGVFGAPAWGPSDDLLGLTASPTPTATPDTASPAPPTVSGVFFGDPEGVEALQGVLAVGVILVGAVVGAAGYRLFSPACFVCGFLAGGLLTARLIESELAHESSVVALSWTGFVLGGLVAGALATFVAVVGILVAVVAGSVLLAFILSAAVGARVYPSNPAQFLGILSVCFAILGGILAWSFEKPVLVSVTSVVGAGMATWGVGRFAGHFPSGAQLGAFQAALAHESWLQAVPDAWWGYLAGFLACFALGIGCQYGKTSRHLHFQRTGRSLKLDAAAPATCRDGHYRDLLAAVNQARPSGASGSGRKKRKPTRAGRSRPRPLAGLVV